MFKILRLEGLTFEQLCKRDVYHIGFLKWNLNIRISYQLTNGVKLMSSYTPYNFAPVKQRNQFNTNDNQKIHNSSYFKYYYK